MEITTLANGSGRLLRTQWSEAAPSGLRVRGRVVRGVTVSMAHYSSHPVPVLISIIDRHPDNPRLGTYNQTVASFAQKLKNAAGVYPPEAAVRLRRLPNRRYQMIDGNHRLDGALGAGMDYVLAFLAEMTDDEALEQVLLANIQRGLTPLEIGLHLLKIKSAQGRAGEGLVALARQLGLSPARVRRYRHAARAFAAARTQLTPDQVNVCRKRAEALTEIATGATPDRWPALVVRCAVEGWTAARARVEVASSAASGGSPAGERPSPKERPTSKQGKAKAKPAVNSKTQLISIRVPHELLAALRKGARARRMPYQALLKDALRAGLPLVVNGVGDVAPDHVDD